MTTAPLSRSTAPRRPPTLQEEVRGSLLLLGLAGGVGAVGLLVGSLLRLVG